MKADRERCGKRKEAVLFLILAVVCNLVHLNGSGNDGQLIGLVFRGETDKLRL